jgi:hypothetical protein
MRTQATQLAIFADPSLELWGIVVIGQQTSLALGGVRTGRLEALPVDVAADDGTWSLTGAGCELQLSPTPVGSATAGATAIGTCQVLGTLAAGGGVRKLRATGLRTAATPPQDGGSMRLFGSWFPAGQELGVLALRRRGAASGEGDQITVAARGEEAPLVIDPRLSTTYNGAGEPVRVGVELWLGEAEDDEGLRARRVAGRAGGSSVSIGALRGFAFECVTRGEPGLGVYVLAASPGEPGLP